MDGQQLTTLGRGAKSAVRDSSAALSFKPRALSPVDAPQITGGSPLIPVTLANGLLNVLSGIPYQPFFVLAEDENRMQFLSEHGYK